MRRALMLRLLVLFTLVANPDAGTLRALYTVKGKAMRRHIEQPCRGGVAVLPEEIKRTEQPLAGQVLTVQTGGTPDGKVVTRVKADAAGRFSLRLAAGRYCVRLGEVQPAEPRPPMAEPLGPRARPPDPQVDADCLERLRHPPPTCDAQLEVGDADVQGFLVVQSSSNQCPQPWAQPCYRGPMPP